MKPLIGLALGIILGIVAPVSIEPKIFAVILLAALDSIFGGLSANLAGNFSDTVLIVGFCVNAAFAIFFIFLGNALGVELYCIALLIFGLRIFKNLTALKNHLLKKYAS